MNHPVYMQRYMVDVSSPETYTRSYFSLLCVGLGIFSEINASRKNFWQSFLSFPFIHTYIENNCIALKFVITDIFIKHALNFNAYCFAEKFWLKNKNTNSLLHRYQFENTKPSKFGLNFTEFIPQLIVLNVVKLKETYIYFQKERLKTSTQPPYVRSRNWSI